MVRFFGYKKDRESELKKLEESRDILQALVEGENTQFFMVLQELINEKLQDLDVEFTKILNNDAKVGIIRYVKGQIDAYKDVVNLVKNAKESLAEVKRQIDKLSISKEGKNG